MKLLARTFAAVNVGRNLLNTALKLAFLVAALLTLASFWSTRRLPPHRLTA